MHAMLAFLALCKYICQMKEWLGHTLVHPGPVVLPLPMLGVGCGEQFLPQVEYPTVLRRKAI